MRRLSVRAVVAVGCSAVLLGAVPAAYGRPRVQLDELVAGDQFGRDGLCYEAGSLVAIRGSGFAGRRVIRFGGDRVRPDARGRFGFILTVRTARAQQHVALRFRQGTPTGVRRATLRFWAAVEGVHVPSWEGSGPALAVPGRVVRARIGDVPAIGRALYVHYVRDGRQVFAQRLGRLRGPCGALDFRLVQFPFAPLEPGLYRVDFGVRPTWDPDAGYQYPGVRVGPVPPPTVPPPDALFTIAGRSGRAPFSEGAPATASALPPGLAVTAQADGSVLVAAGARVLRVDPAGRATTVAGTGAAGFSGDGGPAVSARIDADDVTALPDGGFAFTECSDTIPFRARVRVVDPAGMIGTLTSRVACPVALTAMADGSLVVADADWRIKRVGTDGAVTRLAGTGDVPEPGQRSAGGPALRTPVGPSDVAVASDGSILVADDWAHRVYRLAAGRLTPVAGRGAEGARADDGLPALDAAITPVAVAPRAAGGFFVVDGGDRSAAGSQPRVRVVGPDGLIATLAGSGRYAPTPGRSDELRGDGMPPLQADLRDVSDVAELSDGGVVFAEAGLVRYLPPTVGRLAVALRRDRDRLFTPGRPGTTTIRLTAAAVLTLQVRDGDALVSTQTVSLPAGESRVPLPALADRPYALSASATDAGGRTAEDHAAVYPRRWLSMPLARSVAQALIHAATRADGYSGDGIAGCVRAAPWGVDCRLNPFLYCSAVVSLRLGDDHVLRWATRRCPSGKPLRVRRRLAPLRRTDYSCLSDDPDCPPPVFGVISPRWLVPWD